MTLQNWSANGWLRAHQSSRQEIADLFGIVDRDLHDAGAAVSADWRFGIPWKHKILTIA